MTNKALKHGTSGSTETTGTLMTSLMGSELETPPARTRAVISRMVTIPRGWFSGSTITIDPTPLFAIVFATSTILVSGDAVRGICFINSPAVTLNT